MSINLMSGKAGSWLTANRDALTSSAKEKFEEIVLAALELQVQRDLYNSEYCESLNDESLSEYSLFLEAMALYHGGKWREFCLNMKIKDKWLDLPYVSTSLTYRDFLAKEHLMIGVAPTSDEVSLDGCDLIFPSSGSDCRLLLFLNEWLKVDSGTIQVLEPKTISHRMELNLASRVAQRSPFVRLGYVPELRNLYQLKKEPQPAYSAAVLAMRLRNIARSRLGNQRCYLNCDKRWSKLFLKVGTKVSAHKVLTVFSKDTKPVLLPFLFRFGGLEGTSKIEVTPEQLDAICKWVAPHLITPASLDEIRKVYLELIDYIDKDIMKPSPHWNFWKTERGLE